MTAKVALSNQTTHGIDEEVKTCRATSTMLKAHDLKDYIAKSPKASAAAPKDVAQKDSPFEVKADLSQEEVDATNEFLAYAYSEASSDISAYFGSKVTHLDVLMIFFEIMKLSVKDRENQKLARQLDRECQIEHMTKIVENFKQQGQWRLMSCLGAGAIGIFSGACPIIGHLWGDKIKNIVSTVPFLSDVKNMDKKRFTESMMKVTQQIADVYKQSSEVQHQYAEGDRTFDDTYKQMYNEWAQERSQALQEALQEWRSLENFLSQMLSWQHDSAKSLYNF